MRCLRYTNSNTIVSSPILILWCVVGQYQLLTAFLLSSFNNLQLGQITCLMMSPGSLYHRECSVMTPQTRQYSLVELAPINACYGCKFQPHPHF